MDQDPSTRHVLEGRELIDYLVEKASGVTGAEVLEREERRNRRMAALLSVLTFVGIGAIVGAIKMFVQQEIINSEVRVRAEVTTNLTEEFSRRHAEFEKTVTASIASRVDAEVGAVRTELQHYKLYQELIAHSEAIAAEAANGKSADVLIAMALEAISTLSDVAGIRSQPRFLDTVNEVVDILVRTDRKADIERLETQLGDVLGQHRAMTIDLLDHYGELIMSSPYPAERMPTESQALTRYVAAARQHGYPERALMWELFVAYKSNGYRPNRTTESMVEMTRDLSERDLDELCYQLVLHSHPLHWMTKPDHEGREMARVVNGLLTDHAALRETLQQQAEEAGLAARLAELATRRQERSQALTPRNAEPAELPAEETEVAQAPDDAANTLRR